jgi:hypothetical protein
VALLCAAVEDVESCREPVAVLSSPTTEGGSVLRLVARGGAAPPLLAPRFTPIASGPDSSAAALTVLGDARLPAWTAAGPVVGCVLTHLGLNGFGTSASGRVFAAAGAACGPGARVVRVDGADGGDARLDAAAVAGIALEDRIGSVTAVLPAPDGTRVLVRDEAGFWLLDASLRVLGFRAAGAGARSAWLPASPTSPRQRLALVDGGTLVLLDPASLLPLASVATGTVRGTLLLIEMNGRPTAVFVPARDPSSLVVQPLPRE